MSLSRSELERQLARAEKWAANMEQHGQFETCHHEAARGLRARLAAMKQAAAPAAASKEK